MKRGGFLVLLSLTAMISAQDLPEPPATPLPEIPPPLPAEPEIPEVVPEITPGVIIPGPSLPDEDDPLEKFLNKPFKVTPSTGDPLSGILGGGNDGPNAFKERPDKFRITNGTFELENVAGNFIMTYRGLRGGRLKLIADNGLQVFANRAVYDQGAGMVRLKGNVSAYQGGLVYRGDSAVFDVEDQTLDTSGLRTGVGPILLEAGKFQTKKVNNRTVLLGDDAGVTTHDVENPDFWLRAKKTSIFPGDKVIFQDLKLRAGDRSLFWLPYLSQPFDANLGYLIVPGARSNIGAFVKNRYGLMLGGERDPITGENEDAWLLSQWHADLYSLRGLGLGVDFFDTRVDEKAQFGWLKLYYIYDFNATDQRAGIDRGSVDPNRYRVEFTNRIDLWDSKVAKYSLDANLNLVSDEFYLEDFDPARFRVNRAPDNFIGLTRRSANSLTSLGTRIRLNNFYQSDTRLPELTHDWIRQPLFGSPVLYESQTSLGFYEEHFAERQRDSLRAEAENLLPGDPRAEEIGRLLGERGFARFHTYHEATLPLKFGHLNVVPRIGAGYTNYRSVLGPEDSTDRTHLSAGVDFSTKLTKHYPDLISKRWGLDGARHIIQPYASLSFLATDELDSSFGVIERLTPSTRPRSQRVGRFTAVDDLADWSIMRMGVRNRLVTRRDGATHDWLTVDTYFDAFFEDPEFDREFSNLYNEIRWDPVPWFDLEFETQFPLFTDENFTEIAATMRFLPTENFEFEIEYRHLNNHPILRDSDRIVLEGFARLNEYWGIGTHHRFEAVDQTMELQQYSLYHDFDSFVGSVGFFHRNNRADDEFGIMFSFGIKEIPNLSLPIEIGSE